MIGFKVPKGARASWIMLFLTWVLWVMNANDREIMFRVQPSIINEFHLSGVQWGYLVSLFFLAYALVALPAGIIADKIGRGWKRKKSQVWYMVVFTTFSILVGIKATCLQLWQFVLWRVLGMGAAGGAEVTNIAQCSEYWPREHRGFALGLHHTGYPVGALLGGLAASGILAAFGSDNWRLVFLFTPIIGYILALALWMFATPKSYREVNDYAHAHGLTAPSDEPEAILTFREQLAETKNVLANRHILLTVIGAGLINFSQTVGLWFLAPYVVFTMHQQDTFGAIIGVVPYITGWFGQLFFGYISDHIGRRKTLIFLSAWYAICVFSLSYISGIGMLWVILLMWGLGLNAVFPVYYAMMADHAPKASGSAMGLLLMLTFLGTLPASPLAGWLIDHFGGWDNAQGYLAGFVVGSVAALLAAILQFFTRDNAAAIPR
ncbi:MFS transporter [Martelella alba]|uniref:MFS transporter n=1 Tax=Martelella alba TaxID=2590451 RepID=A0ABY2SGL1_9HYPH|nr:MFS transporter [Martelella alba]TKI04305.1 MFS transporter [Martelella alba]